MPNITAYSFTSLAVAFALSKDNISLFSLFNRFIIY